MTGDLAVDDFPTFFEEVHGYGPFPWQTRLAKWVCQTGQWPSILDLPTAAGKTAALDIGIFHLALEAHKGVARRAPVRIAFVVDRRLVVDDAFTRAVMISSALVDAQSNTVTSKVAISLRGLAGERSSPVLVRRLRGGIPRESDWARTPSQPTILCSTVDQVGSRLLFRGYGVSDSMKPVHAGLLGSDCLILLDEAHLSEPFRQTLKWAQGFRGEAWRERKETLPPWGMALLTATPGTKSADRWKLAPDDLADPVLSERWRANKPARLIHLPGAERTRRAASDSSEEAAAEVDGALRIEAIVSAAEEALRSVMKRMPIPVMAVVLNRVARARAVFMELRKRCESSYGAGAIESILLIGPSRPIDRDFLADRLRPIRTGAQRVLEKPLVIVATQCIEAGVDIDLDGLVTEAAPLDALRQRFGRLNRAGRDVAPYAAILGGAKSDSKDPVYGEALTRTWKYLTENPDREGRNGVDAEVDFGLAAFQKRLESDSVQIRDLLSPKADAPVLLPAHLGLLSHTAPVPTADPEIALYLHGPGRNADAVTLVWRADIDPDLPAGTYELLQLMPPRATEAIEVPVWAARQWLNGQHARLAALADVPGPDEQQEEASWERVGKARVFRWTGDKDSSEWIFPARIRPGETLVIPARYGGVDQYGWNPDSTEPAADVADEAAAPFSGRRYAVRVAPGLLNGSGASLLLAAIAEAASSHWRDLRDAVRAINLPPPLAAALDRLNLAKRGKVEAYTELYGEEEGLPRGVVFLAPLGLKGHADNQDAALNATEADESGSLPGFALSLAQHSEEVEHMAEAFARLAGLSEDRVFDLKLAGYLHDAGKVDTRFQKWLAYDDPLGPDPNSPDQILAKSARPLPRGARVQSGLPERWRHEALSVRLAPKTARFHEAKDPELVLWLIGTHHGYGRPFFPHTDPGDCATRSDLPTVLGIPAALDAGAGPQSLAYDWQGMDWPSLYERLKGRYGVWELARMEAILRLADHRASEQAEERIVHTYAGGVEET